MKLIWDETKRQVTLKDRELDFADANEVIEGKSFSFEETHKNYGETCIVPSDFFISA